MLKQQSEQPGLSARARVSFIWAAMPSISVVSVVFARFAMSIDSGIAVSAVLVMPVCLAAFVCPVVPIHPARESMMVRVVRAPVFVMLRTVFEHAVLCAMMRSAQEIRNFLELVQQLV
jgi:hypothetical protein